MIFTLWKLQRGKERIVLIVRSFDKLDNDIYYCENIDWIWATYAFPFSLYPKPPLNWTCLFDQLGNLNPSREVESGKFYGFLPIFCQFNCFQKMLTEAHGGKLHAIMSIKQKKSGVYKLFFLLANFCVFLPKEWRITRDHFSTCTSDRLVGWRSILRTGRCGWWRPWSTCWWWLCLPWYWPATTAWSGPQRPANSGGEFTPSVYGGGGCWKLQKDLHSL